MLVEPNCQVICPFPSRSLTRGDTYLCILLGEGFLAARHDPSQTY